MSAQSARGTLKRVALIGTASILVLLAICVFRALVYFPTPKRPAACDSTPGHQKIKLTNELKERFKEALRHKTITSAPYKYDAKELLRFHDYITKSESPWRVNCS